MPDTQSTTGGGPTDLADKLKGLGMADSGKLLAGCRTPLQRRELASRLGVNVDTVTELANRADLARIKGVAGVYADLLENAGVDTVKELGHRVPANLHSKLVQVNTAKSIAKRVPTAGMVADWVDQAKRLPPVLEY